ncbi:MAG: HAMP domain-containing sensor histidine kinase [Desulfocurvibacter africanus]
MTPDPATAQNDKSLLSASESDARRNARTSGRERMAFLETRVHEKIDDYEDYRFTLLESRALNIFFDLAQEYDNVFDLYALCVLVPKIFFQKQATLFLIGKDDRLEWRCSAAVPWDEEPGVVKEPPLVQKPTVRDGRFYIPIKGNRDLLEQMAFSPKRTVIGLLDVTPAENLSSHERLFFEKYANRIGFQLHNRLISTKNREHLQFIRSLVDDIGHNVIVPNMYFKLFYRRLESKIRVLREISTQFAEFTGSCAIDDSEQTAACKRLQKEMDYTYESLMEQFREIYRHYEQTSMFLETLLRRGHFEQGHYVLEMQPANVQRQIVAPQVERFRGRLGERGIKVVEPEGKQLDPGLEAEVDVGLISQVFSNLFSNAVKYTREVEDSTGRRKYVTYGCALEPDRYGRGQDGVRCYVFSTGPNLTPQEADRLYTEGFRGSNVQGEYGTGHGLHFVREVVTLHGGEVGYEPVEGGNIFSFVLPVRKGSAAGA